MAGRTLNALERFGLPGATASGLGSHLDLAGGDFMRGALALAHVPSTGYMTVTAPYEQVFQGAGPLNVVLTGPSVWTTLESNASVIQDLEQLSGELAARLTDYPVVVGGAIRRDEGIFFECRFEYDRELEQTIYQALEELEQEHGLLGQLQLAALYETEEA